MTKRDLPSFDAKDLKAYSDSESVERVWRRLEANLDANSSTWRPRRVGWSVALAAATFGAGLWVGRHSEGPELEVQPQLSAEPTQAAGRAPTHPAIVAPQDVEGKLIEDQLLPTHPQPVPGRRRGNSPADNPRTPDESESEGVDVVATAPSDGVLDALPSAEPVVVEVPAEPPQWQRLANGGEYEAALFDLAQAGGFETVLGGANAEQLMLLADIARATGQRQRAMTALRRVVSDFPSDPVAPLAAWSLGRALEKAGDREGASAAFAAYRSLSPQGDFAEDALVRQLKTAVQRREREVAQELAAQYSTDFPQGRRRDEVARWVAMLASMAEASEVDAGVPEVAFPPLEEELQAFDGDPE